MSLTVTRARVKEKCGITASTYDSTIDNLIAEVVPTIEFAIRLEHIADTGNSGLQATLNLGAAEIVCGEFLEQLLREPGALEIVKIGDLELRPLDAPVGSNALTVKESGWAKLAPFLKADPSGVAATSISSAGGKAGTSETVGAENE